MLIRCERCSAAYGKDSRRAQRDGPFTCKCGHVIELPEPPKESFFFKLRDRLGISVACGLICAGFVAVVPFGFFTLRAMLPMAIAFTLGSIGGAIGGERLFDWLSDDE